MNLYEESMLRVKMDLVFSEQVQVTVGVPGMCTFHWFS